MRTRTYAQRQLAIGTPRGPKLGYKQPPRQPFEKDGHESIDDISDAVFFNHYRDRGCEIHPACLECPLPVCVHDEPNQAIKMKLMTKERDKPKIVDFNQAFKDMEYPDAIAFVAKKYSITDRTVQRVLARNT